MELIARVKNILFSPREEWPVIEKEEGSLGDLYLRYALILIVASAGAKSLGLVLFGLTMPHGHIAVPLSLALGKALFEILVELGSLLLMSYVIDFLAPRFEGKADFLASNKLVVFSSTPSWIGGLLGLFPPLSLLGILFSFYGLYLFYLGVPIIKKIPPSKALLFTGVVVIVGLALFFFLGLLLGPFHPMHLR